MSSTPPTVSNTPGETHRISLETARPAMAKADLKKVADDLRRDEEDGRRAYGQVVGRTFEIASLTDAQASDALGKNDGAQVSRWKAGKENPQTWRLQQHPTLGPALVQAEAEDLQARGGAVEVETVIRIRRELPWNGIDRRRA